jgi:hypothetical protein
VFKYGTQELNEKDGWGDLATMLSAHYPATEAARLDGEDGGQVLRDHWKHEEEKVLHARMFPNLDWEELTA